MHLVQEGKLSPEDAAELIEAFTESQVEDSEPEADPAAVEVTPEEMPPAEAPKEAAAPKEEPAKAKDPFASFLSAVEKIGKDVAQNIDWQDIAGQVKTGVGKGVEAVKKAADDAGIGQNLGALFGVAEGKVVELPIQIPEGKLLKIESAAGDLKIIGGHELGSLKASASFRAFSAEEAKKKAATYTPFIEENDQFVLVRLNEGPDSKVDAVFHIPAGTPLDIKNSSGKAEVAGISAPVKIHGSSGAIDLKKINGAIEIASASGAVSIEDTDSSLVNVDSKSGEVSLTRVGGAISIRTSSGSISMQEVHGRSVSAETASGSIEADFSKPIVGNVSLRAVSGTVVAEIADGSDCRVSLSALQGAVASTVDLEDMTQEGMTIRGRLGDGTGSLELSAVSGLVRLGWRDATAV